MAQITTLRVDVEMPPERLAKTPHGCCELSVPHREVLFWITARLKDFPNAQNPERIQPATTE